MCDAPSPADSFSDKPPSGESSSGETLSREPLPCLILAAGASRRMGRCKLTLPYKDGLLITPVLQLARAAAPTRTVVVVPPVPAPGLCEAVADHGLAWVAAHRAAEGQAESLKAGVAAVVERWPAAAGVLVLLGDQPLISVETVRAVQSEFFAHPECAVAAAYNGRRGHPVILPRAAFAEVAQLSGDTGARRLLERFCLRLVPCADEAVLVDVDDAEAYQKLSAE